MNESDSLRQVRIDKLNKLGDMGINPFPAKSKRTHLTKDVIKSFNSLAKFGKEVTLSGRLMSKREHGGLVFSEIMDRGGNLQILFKKDELSKKIWSILIDQIDIGDFVQVSGKMFLTKRKEQTLLVKSFVILTKALRSLPEKWYGLTDHETRFRQRYLDILMNPEIRDRFITNHKLTQAIRKFLIDRDFIEVDTPALQPLPGGAIATPFKTHYDALNTNAYLRIAPELYLKRLIIGGYERVFEFARVFRNEGASIQHLQDFTMLEFYQAYATYKDLMKLTEEMLSGVIKEVIGSYKIKFQDKTIDFKTPWPIKTFKQLIFKETGIDIDKQETVDKLSKAIKAKKINLTYTGKTNRGKLIDELYKERVRPKIINPIFLIDHPLDLSPLAKKKENDPTKVQRFQLVVCGMELVNAFSELNDPIDQKARFIEQAKHKKSGDKEAHSMDNAFVKALEYGMPPTAGWGMGMERLLLLLTNAESIREAVLFPFIKDKSR